MKSCVCVCADDYMTAPVFCIECVLGFSEEIAWVNPQHAL